MDRRSFVHASALALFGVPLRCDAECAGRMPRIGFLTPGPSEGLLSGMRVAGTAREAKLAKRPFAVVRTALRSHG